MSRAPFELDINPGTTSSGVRETSPVSQTLASITREFGRLRDKTSFLDENVGVDHRRAQLQTLELVARERLREGAQRLLEDLSVRRGLGWTDIARVVGVSVQAIRKWRAGQPATGENQLSLARLAALLDLLADVPVASPAAWLEVPVLTGYAPRHMDVYYGGRPDLLFDLAHLRITPEVALQELDPDWRDKWKLDHEVFTAADDNLSIRRRQ